VDQQTVNTPLQKRGRGSSTRELVSLGGEKKVEGPKGHPWEGGSLGGDFRVTKKTQGRPSGLGGRGF